MFRQDLNPSQTAKPCNPDSCPPLPLLTRNLGGYISLDCDQQLVQPSQSFPLLEIPSFVNRSITTYFQATSFQALSTQSIFRTQALPKPPLVRDLGGYISFQPEDLDKQENLPTIPARPPLVRNLGGYISLEPRDIDTHQVKIRVK